MNTEEAVKILVTKFSNLDDIVDWFIKKLQTLCNFKLQDLGSPFMTGEDALIIEAIVKLTGIGGSTKADPWTAIRTLCRTLERHIMCITTDEGKTKCIKDSEYSYFISKLKTYIKGMLYMHLFSRKNTSNLKSTEKEKHNAEREKADRRRGR